MRLLGEAERAGQAATALGRALGLYVQVLEQRHFRLEADHCMMVAMRLHERAAALERLGEAFEMPRDEIGEMDDLLRQPLRLEARGKQAGQLVLEGGGAGRLQTDDRRALPYFRLQRGEALRTKGSGFIEKYPLSKSAPPT